MPTDPATNVFNDGYIAELYDAYLRDPASVSESWQQFFRAAERFAGSTTRGAPDGVERRAPDPALLKKAAGAAALMQAIRTYGHFAVQLDPLGTPPLGAPELSPEFHGITEADLESVPGSAVGFPHMATAADVLKRLRLRYTTTLGFEVTHLAAEEERKWFRQMLTAEELTKPLTPDEKRSLLRRLTEVDGLERFIARAYPNVKRFGIEGTDALVPMLDETIARGAAAGAHRVVIAMAHRGRINVLAHILGKQYATIIAEFEGKHDDDTGTGDVKYHLGAHATRGTVDVTLLPNPSHLEFVNPVLEGVARALEREGKERDEASVIPVCIHGDAAFPGEGVVTETFNLSRLPGFRVGGTLHIIVNNQIGFTTDPIDGRSTYYASDLAKGFDVPIVHVNADNAEACVIAVRIAIAYRSTFGKDFLIDLVGYRRNGHNEGDEPSFTQPMMYDKIKAHPTARQVWGQRLVSEGVATAADVQAVDKEILDKLTAVHAQVTSGTAPAAEGIEPVYPGLTRPASAETAVPRERLVALNDRLLAWPEGFTAHPRVARAVGRRREALSGANLIDWGEAESLALASLLTDGTSVRLTGQDAARGTFSHRHAALHDVKTGAIYVPLQNLPGTGVFEVHNSPLSETAVLGFEYGYAAAAPDWLVLWEAQYGDFVNVAQPIIDQFLAADRAKWGEGSRVVLLLPHGYEGGGPEHSSARLERFLQLAAEGNMQIAYPSTPAQYFHLLRSQAMTAVRRPLVLMQPKSLLRLDRAMSSVNDLATGQFHAVIDDPTMADPEKRWAVRRVVFCTGKIYYDLTSEPRPSHVAIVRIEGLYPWPQDEVAHVLERYAEADDIVWVQEEPKNMGAWSFVMQRSSGIRYIGRPDRASPAEGYMATHQKEQARIVAEALAAPIASDRPSIAGGV
ncbi:MAG TPA: 2-oxoglutarate dehydrogenase E1 component [Gemmatimonadaceae bacterium]|jgi:2-oxoglutarate dehydrogenase E1 component|nr:2-oxoglutarate dehydrogenase E1 component [Gemmatimonadaceae bacterium]